MPGVLAHKTIWLTRPAHQARGWAGQIEAVGGVALCEPLLAIEAPRDPDLARAALARVADADIVIATSSNAVMSAWRLRPSFAPRGALYGVGAASSAALARASGRAVAQPAGCYSSEGLLALDSLAAPVGQRVALLAGEGGRTAIADRLAARGAQIDKIALYRRQFCDISPVRLGELLAASDAVVVTSGEALSHLVRLVDRAERPALHSALDQCRLVAPSVRVVQEGAKRVNWTRAPVIVDRVSGEAVVAALARIWRGDE